MNDQLKRFLTVGGAVAALAGGGAAIAGATGGEDSEKPIAGEAGGKAEEAAVQAVGGGKVTGTEVGDEEGYYEVEVTRGDGSQVDVHLDQGFNVVSGQADRDEPDDGPGDHDD